MRRITVNASLKYDVIIGQALLSKCGEYSAQCVNVGKALIVSDDNVAPLYLETVRNSLNGVGFETEAFIIKHGEQSKTLLSFAEILNFMAEKHFSRSDTVFALGGGVVGDLAGFCAASYMRGIAFVQLPTSLLAFVDSSVGGKTAVDLENGKNLAGAFHQPHLVLCDTDALKTLPNEFFSDGMAEVIKYCVISDKLPSKLLTGDINKNLEEVIEHCVTIKRNIVDCDEFEHGTRKLLNFGHTIGHAIELAENYRLPHGHAVAKGMYIITRSCVKSGLCSENCLKTLSVLLAKYNLSTICTFDAETLYNAALSDKKRSGEVISLILPQAMGQSVIKEASMAELHEIIQLGLE